MPLIYQTNTVDQKTILVVEDDPDVVRLICLVLQDAGHKVLTALDAESALATCKQYSRPIHLLVSDVVLTGICGPELAQHLYEKYPSLAVIFMTGYPVEQVHADIMGVPHNLLLIKPIRIGALVSRVTQVLNWPTRKIRH